MTDPASEFDPQPPPRVGRLKLHALGAGSAIGMTLLAVVIWWWRDVPWSEPFASEAPLWLQIAGGAALGLLFAAGITVAEFAFPVFKEIEDFGRQIFQAVRPRWWDLLIISVGAGWGEEVLFRGAIQPVLGIWPAALLFMLVHGTWTRLTPGFFAYTLLLLFAGAALGYLSQWLGLAAAMTAHGVYDFAVLLFFGLELRRRGEL